jgi:hypothetical protein
MGSDPVASRIFLADRVVFFFLPVSTSTVPAPESTGLTVDDLDAVAFQQLAHVFGEVGHHLVLAGQHGRQVQSNLAGLDAVFGKTVLGQVVILGNPAAPCWGCSPH